MCRRNTIIHICLLEICWEKNEPERAQSMDSLSPRTSKRGGLSPWKSQSVYSKRYAPNTSFKAKPKYACALNLFIIHEESRADRQWKTPCGKTSKCSVSSSTVSLGMRTTCRDGKKSCTTRQMSSSCSSLTAAARCVVGMTKHFWPWNIAFQKTFLCLQVCIGRCLERGKNSGRTDDNRESLNKRYSPAAQTTCSLPATRVPLEGFCLTHLDDCRIPASVFLT